MARICQRCSHQNEDHAKFCLSCGAMLEIQAAADDDPLIGKVLLSRYRPLSVLGEGGMGKVYLAEQKIGTATRKVAIKTLHPELANDPQIIARFRRESETVIELRHPNTIQFYDFGELEDGTLIIVMEYIRGKALATFLEEEGPFDPQRADKIIIQVCGSLHEAHQRGIIHRDLKPENVLLTDQGGQTDFVKVLDFGIAKRDDAEDPNQAKLTKQGMVLGTPPYMSPEQFSGQKLDARSDVYSLGVMVYEMLTGKLPFEAATPWEWATKHLTAEPTPIEAHPAGARVPPGKRMAVMRALSKNREARQSSVLEFLQEFTGYHDADAAWTMATSAGGGILPSSGGSPAVRSPAPTPTPGWGAAPSQNPGAFNAPGQMGHGSQPGLASHPGYGPAPGFPPTASHSSMPGYSNPGYPGHASYSTGPRRAASSGGILGKLLAVGLVGFFVLAGGAAGLAWYLNQSDDDVSEPVTSTEPSTTTGTNNPAPGPNDPPTIPTTLSPEPNDEADPPSADPSNAQPASDEPASDQPAGNESPGDVTPVQPTQVQAEPAGTQVTTKNTTKTATPRRPRGPSAADEARARALTTAGMGAARRNDFAGAIAALRQAQNAVGRQHSITTELRNELSRRGSNQVGILLQQGHCEQARALYRQLSSVGASSAARRQFGDWCPAR